MPENNNLDNILQVLSELDKTCSFEVYIPSLKKNIKFKQLNTEQLKQLFKTNIDSNVSVYNTKFVLLLNNFIRQNCLESEININDLTILDKFLILFKTRIESISAEYNFIIEKTNYKVNIENNYNNFVKHQPNLQPQTINKENYTIVISLPTIEIENKLEEEFYKNTNTKINSKEDLQNILANTFVNETAKYIQNIKTNNGEIDLNNLDFSTRLTVVEKLPATIVNEILKYIEQYKNLISTLTTCDVTLENGQHVLKEVPINMAFFSV